MQNGHTMYAMKSISSLEAKILEKLFINNLLTALERYGIMKQYESVCEKADKKTVGTKRRRKRKVVEGNQGFLCMYKYFFKRLFDILLSFVGLIVALIPMLFIIIAIKVDSKGPAIFKTYRVGKNKKPFKFYKFRSMRIDAPEDCAPRLLQTDYVTKVGKFLRRTSLDELPQLWCILKGDMSIVGPRPAGLSEHDLVEARDRHGANSVTPGLTGLAQVSGRDILASHPEEKALVDGLYAKKITAWRDFKICIKTVGKVFKSGEIVEGSAALNEALSDESKKEIEEAILSEKEETTTVAQQGIVYAEEKTSAETGGEAVV